MIGSPAPIGLGGVGADPIDDVLVPPQDLRQPPRPLFARRGVRTISSNDQAIVMFWQYFLFAKGDNVLFGVTVKMTPLRNPQTLE